MSDQNKDVVEVKKDVGNQVQMTTLTFTLGDILRQRQDNKNKKK